MSTSAPGAARRGTTGARGSRGRSRPARACRAPRAGTSVDDRLVDLGQPPVGDQAAVLAAEVEVRGERREVVEQPPGLGVLDVEAGEGLQLAAVVAELDDLGLDPDLVAVEVGDDVELVDVEAEVVEPLDALLDAPHLVGAELLLVGELGPQRVVALRRAARRSRGASTSSSRELAGLEVEELGEDVLAGDGQVVLAHAARQAARCSSPVSASTR